MKSRWPDILRHGLVAGLIGGAATSVLYALSNVLQGRSPFYTAATLGAVLFYGVRDAAQVVVTPAYVFAYSGTHLVVFIALGVLGAWLASLAERGAQLWYLGLFFFIFASFHLMAAVQVVAAPMQRELSAPAMWIAGIGAGMLMSWYLLRSYPGIAATADQEEFSIGRGAT